MLRATRSPAPVVFSFVRFWCHHSRLTLSASVAVALACEAASENELPMYDDSNVIRKSTVAGYSSAHHSS